MKTMDQTRAATGDLLREFDWTDFDSATQAVVMAVASEAGTDPMEMEPLQTAVDPDSLNSLFRTGSGSRRPVTGRVEFDYLGYRVVLSAGGRGYLRETEETTALGGDCQWQAVPASND